MMRPEESVVSCRGRSRQTSPVTEISLLPTAWALRAQNQSRRDFEDAYAETRLLLVEVTGPDSEIATALAAAVGLATEPVMPSVAYATEVMVIEDKIKRSLPPIDPARLSTYLGRGTFVVAPLRKRRGVGKPFAERISVGRARNNDIVLRDGSVSKFHAWFECDDNEAFYVVDAGSTNKTVLEGQEVGRDPLVVRDGAKLRFGSVDCVLVRPGTLWDAMHPA
jgi:hypothetical protein